MQNKKYYFIFSFFTVLIFIGFVFLFFPSTKVFALQLNADLPAVPGSAAITPQSTVPEYLKWVFDFGMLLAGIIFILSMAVAGVYYIISPAIPSMQAKAKDRVVGGFSGLTILLLIYLIITTVNPNLSFFKLAPLNQVNTPTASQPKQPGIYLYKTSDCSTPPDPLIKSSTSYDLQTFNSNVQSAKIVQDPSGSPLYIGILFQSSSLWKKCFFINPNSNCNQNITPPFASSVAIYQYNQTPTDGSITFYRDPFFNQNGGSFQVSGAETNGNYIRALKDLNFMKNSSGNPNDPENCTVPQDQMDCVAWNNSGICTKRKCPDLSGEIGSIKIQGNYVVLLVYFGPNDASKGPWSDCQLFPSPYDKIRMGPNKINWENINNQSRIPNYVLIFPVTDNTNPDAVSTIKN